MIAFLTNIAPIALGFVAKLFALKQHAASENQKLMMEQFAAKDKSINDARQMAKNESPMAAMNRRVIILVILGLIIFTQVAPPLLNLPTVIPTTIEGFNFFGIQSVGTMVGVAVLSIVVAFMVKNAYQLFYSWYVQRFSNFSSQQLSSMLLQISVAFGFMFAFALLQSLLLVT